MNIKNTKGFTLIELLVVVSILAALAGITSVAMDGYYEDSQEQITRVEMQRIANAIRRFKADTGYWPKTESTPYTYDEYEDPANFSFLFSQTKTSIPDWTPEYAIGWHGPYIDLAAIKTISKDDFNVDEFNVLKPQGCIDGSKYPSATFITAASENKRMNGLVDRFEQVRQDSSGNVKEASEEYCVLTKRRTKHFDADGNVIWLWNIEDISASPYLYDAKFTHFGSALCTKNTDINLSVTCVALRSFGPDGIDNDGTDDSDDIVFVLEVNSELGE